MLPPTTWMLTAALTGAALLGAACSSPAGQDGSTGPVAAPAAAGDVRQLAASCPSRVVVQSGWYPEATHNFYELLGDRYQIDTAKKRVSGPLVAPDGHGGDIDTGVTIEIRSGGPAVSFQPVADLMAIDKAITLGQQATDEQIAGAAAGRPTLAVFAPLAKDPLIYMWDPRTYPQWTGLPDIGRTNAVVLTDKTAPSTEFLVRRGDFKAGQLDAYDGSPSRFVEAGGKAVVGGYSTKDPYTYRSLPQWGRDVRYAYVADAGYPDYRGVLAVRAGDRARLDGCLHRLVPIMQRAQVEFMRAPDRTLKLITLLNERYQSPYPYPLAMAEAGLAVMRRDKLVSNGDDHTLGDFDLGPAGRVATMVKILGGHGTPADLASNDYLDPTVGLAGGR